MEKIIENTVISEEAKKRAINLRNLSSETLSKGNFSWIKTVGLDGKPSGFMLEEENTSYYFKVAKNKVYLLNDLLGNKITEYFNLPSAGYRLAKGNYQGTKLYGLITKYKKDPQVSYMNLEEFIYSDDSIIESPFFPTNFSFVNALDKVYSQPMLTRQLKTLIIRDLVTNEKDRKMSEIHLKTDNDTILIDKIYDYEIEWNLNKSENELKKMSKMYDTIGIYDIKDSDIDLTYKIVGLLNLTEKDIPYIQKDRIFQATLEKFMNLEVTSLLEQIGMETGLDITSKDMDYYSFYAETMKTKLITKGYLK